jgi:hypothetical protein
MSNPGTADVGPDPDREGDVGRRDGAPAGRIIGNQPLKLIGLSCPVCGYLLPAQASRPVPAPLCAGSKARTSKQHEPTPMQALVIH